MVKISDINLGQVLHTDLTEPLDVTNKALHVTQIGSIDSLLDAQDDVNYSAGLYENVTGGFIDISEIEETVIWIKNTGSNVFDAWSIQFFSDVSDSLSNPMKVETNDGTRWEIASGASLLLTSDELSNLKKPYRGLVITLKDINGLEYIASHKIIGG